MQSDPGDGLQPEPEGELISIEQAEIGPAVHTKVILPLSISGLVLTAYRRKNN